MSPALPCVSLPAHAYLAIALTLSPSVTPSPPIPPSLPVTARELFKQYGCTERLYDEAFNPMLLVGLFAPGEQCSAAAALGMLYYFILAHQVARHARSTLQLSPLFP